MSTLTRRVSYKSRYALLFFCFAIALILMAMPLRQLRTRAQDQSPSRPAGAEANSELVTLPAAQAFVKKSSSPRPNAPNVIAGVFRNEVEPNDTPGTAQALPGTVVRIRGDLYAFPVPAAGDVDVFSFTAAAGDRVYASNNTFFSGGGTDTQIDIIASDGTTVIENDNDDGSFAGLASAVAGTILPTAGTYYVRLRPSLGTLAATVRPYDIYVSVQTGAPTAETEPNGIGAANALPASGWVSGVIDVSGDQDTYSFAANAGDTVVVMLDADPERNGPGVAFWNPATFIGVFNNNYLGVNDASTNSITDPPAEAAYMTVKDTGTYEVLVQAGTAGTFGATFTYHLNINVIPAKTRPSCATYQGAGGPIADNPTTTDFSIVVPDDRRIDFMQLSMSATHNFTSDLDISLVDPEGDEVVFNDDSPDGPAPQLIDWVIDDEAAVAGGAFAIHAGMRYSPEFFSRLNFFKGQSSLGTWRLRFRDDFAADSGTLNNWTITFCQDSFSVCTLPETPIVAAQDFEAGDGGFTHSGTADEWARGLPSGASAPITTCHSGTNCWKTDLTGTYNASSNQDLLSPNINLTTFTPLTPITLRWWQKYQIDSASNDTAFVEVRQVGNPTNFRRVWEWKGADQTRSVGAPAVTVNMAGGWSLMSADITSFAGQNVEVRFHLESNATTQRSGLAIDDFSVSVCLGPTAADSTVQGKIQDANGAAIAGAVVRLSGTQNRKTITDANGDYRFDDVETNGFYSVTPSLLNYHFSPESRSFSQLGNITNAAFTATRDSGVGVNRIDTPEYFVRQHYLDFLNREPDEAGFNFWSDQILECGSDVGCLERRTINVSAAYVLSVEFAHTGALVDGLYRASYGRRPLFAEFMPDTRRISSGVVVGKGDWMGQLTLNKEAFLADWVQRAEFRAAYDGLSNDAYVNALINHTGTSFDASERDALVSSLNSGTSRAEVLRLIAENEQFVSAKRNEMFVMIEYFGYLRRDPDPGGFAFWLNKLNQFNGNFEQAEMVKSFIRSGEYRSRFSQ